MKVNTFSNNLSYMSFDCWQKLWDTRGYISKQVRTARTGKDGHRALSKPIMTGERLTYDAAEECFVLHWYVSARAHEALGSSESSVVLKCYRTMWRIYPHNQNQTNSWMTRGKAMRITKYVPLGSYMHIKNGETVAYGFGRVYNGTVVTHTRQMQLSRNTSNCINQSIGNALNFGTSPSPNSIRYNVKTYDHRGAHDLNYTREVVSRVVSKYVDEAIDELFLKCAALIFGFRPAHGDISETSPNWPKRNYFKHKIRHSMTINVISTINGTTINTAAASVANLFGIDISIGYPQQDIKYTTFAGYPYKLGIIDIERPNYRIGDQSVAQVPSNLSLRYGGTGTPDMLIRHVMSYFYMKNIFVESGGGQIIALNEEARTVEGTHGLFFLFLLVYCVDSIHSFTAMAKLLFGKAAYSYLCEMPGDGPYLLERVAVIFAKDEIENNQDEDFILRGVAEVYRKLFSPTLIKKFSSHTMSMELTTTENMKNFSQYRNIMREVFEVFVTSGVGYADFGLSPYAVHVANNLVVEHGSAYAVSNACANPSDMYSTQTALLSADCITEPNPLVSEGCFDGIVSVPPQVLDSGTNLQVSAWADHTLAGTL